jgi:UDP-N-acetylmuramate--alanine ligase
MTLSLDPSWRRVHLVGMGGAGMSAIAHVLLGAGVEVSGSDMRESATVAALASLGVRVDIGHRAEQAAGADVLIASAAVALTNPEVELATSRGIPVIYRGEALGMLVESCRTVAVSGTHGKTTTSGMVATVVGAAGLDPTFLLGAGLAGRGPGGHLGTSDVAVVEADEAYKSFLHLKPAIAVVTNIDKDHVDHYGSWESLQQAFADFMSSASEALVVCADDPKAVEVARPYRAVTYGLRPEAKVRGAGIKMGAEGAAFELWVGSELQGVVKLPVSGLHNVQNALGAAAACLELGISVEAVIGGLGQFRGVARRFEYRGRLNGAHLVDDYAHHPAEIKATLSAARSGPWKRVVAVFQPHLYSRTQALWREFGEALSEADVIVVTDVYGAREQPVPGVTGKLIINSLCEYAPFRRIAYLPKLNAAAHWVRGQIRPDDLVLSLGAGDITTLHDRLATEPAVQL